LTELTAEVITSIGEVEAIDVSKVIVLFDRFYLCDVVANACKNDGFTYIGAVKENRNFFPDGRPQTRKRFLAPSYSPDTLLSTQPLTINLSSGRNAINALRFSLSIQTVSSGKIDARPRR